MQFLKKINHSITQLIYVSWKKNIYRKITYLFTSFFIFIFNIELKMKSCGTRGETLQIENYNYENSWSRVFSAGSAKFNCSKLYMDIIQFHCISTIKIQNRMCESLIHVTYTESKDIHKMLDTYWCWHIFTALC